jgi:sterol desaturase/sphingolipid hydroxylase (fatty acid hydroxylase superfamily)
MHPTELLNANYFLQQWFFAFFELSAITVIFSLLERIRPIQREVTFDTEKRTELLIYILNRILLTPLIAAFFLYVSAKLLMGWLPYQFWDKDIQSLPLYLQVILGAFILDMSLYVRHRFMHYALWRVHAIHHSAIRINWLTSQRTHPLDLAISIFFDLAVLYLIGFSGDGMVYATLTLFVMNLFAHSNINFEWPGFLRYCFGSPNFHRWHHAREEKEAYDKNFCAIFPFIDLAFGTFYHPAGKLPCSYGIYQRKNELPLDSSFIHQMVYPFVTRK